MKLLFRNLYQEEIIPLKKKINKVIKIILGKDDDPFGNSCLIL
jgi:hypothetical protein